MSTKDCRRSCGLMDIPEILKHFLSDLQSKEECEEILKFINEEPRAIQMMSTVIVDYQKAADP